MIWVVLGKPFLEGGFMLLVVNAEIRRIFDSENTTDLLDFFCHAHTQFMMLCYDSNRMSCTKSRQKTKKNTFTKNEMHTTCKEKIATQYCLHTPAYVSSVQ